jgi:transcriptional antiterminator NusG
VPDRDEPSTDEEPPFRPGDRVRVIDGPFADFPALVREVNAGRRKLSVTVHIFGRESPFDLDFAHAAKLDTDAE